MTYRLIHGWGLTLALALGCGDDAGPTDDGGDGSDSATPTSTTDTPTTSTSADSAATSAADASGDGSTTSMTTDTPTSDSGGSDTGVAVDCAGTPCDDGEICIVPCCGGAPAACTPARPNGGCPPDSVLVDGSECVAGCEGDQCCMPIGPCVPDPPYCAPGDGLACGGRIDQCDLDGCSGTLQGGTLTCMCA